MVADYQGSLFLFESTTLNDLPCKITGRPIRGVQAQDPNERITTYKGKVWVLRMTRAWELGDLESSVLSAFWLKYIGTPYDEVGAILSEIREQINITPADLDHAFCSEMCAAADMRIGRLPLDNPGRYTPGRYCRHVRRIGIRSKMECLK
jgi:hypothetical protein